MEKVLIIAQNNCETSCAVWQAIIESPDKFMAGMNRVLETLNLAKVRLYLPKYIEANADIKAAVTAVMPECVQITSGFVNVRELDDTCIVYHPEEIFAGSKDILEKHIEIVDSEKKYVLGTAKINDTVKTAVEKIYGTVPADIKAVKAGKACVYPEKLESIQVADLEDARIELIGKNACMVQMAKASADAMYAGTCGRCTFCRETAYQVKTILHDITEGQGLNEDSAMILEMAREAHEESMCSFGQQGLKFAADTVLLFADDYEEHIKFKNCSVGVCKGFYDVAIDGGLCDGCGKCAQICKDSAVFGKEGYIHFIDTYDCSRCGKCIELCPQEAISYVRKGRQMGPTRMIQAGRYRTSRRHY